MDNKILEIFIPGPAGRLEAKYYKSKKNTSPIALVLQPHPQYGGTMNNNVVVNTFHTFMDNDFSVCRVNFRGVGKSDGEFDNGQGELADAAASLDWLERENFDNSQCWVSGFSFGSLIAMQLLMRRPEINRFIAISPQPNVYDFSFLSPCPSSGLMIYGKKDELVPLEYITELDKRLSAQKGIKVDFQSINEPKENPDTQHCELSKFSLSSQSNAAAASASSPCPLSNSPSLLPTPLKFTLHTEKSLSINV
jgi:alpha/beta superfamily hydrolase